MANPESEFPRENGDITTEEGSEVKSGTVLKKEEPTVVGSPGIWSPTVDRILGKHNENASSVQSIADGKDEFCDTTFLNLILEDARVIEFSDRAILCSIPVDSIKEKFRPKTVFEYYTLLCQMIDLILYNIEVLEGKKSGAPPFVFISKDLNHAALASARDIFETPWIIEELKILAAGIKDHNEELSKKV